MKKILIGNLKGPQGKQGEEGKQGEQGLKGARGSRWLSGTDIEGTDTNGQVFATGIADSEVNDYYLNTKTGNLYRCIQPGDENSALWVFVGNIYKFVPEVVDNLDSDSEEDALSARQGKKLYEDLIAKIPKVTEISIKTQVQTFDFAIEIENVDTSISWLVEINGMPEWETLEYEASGNEKTKVINISVKKLPDEYKKLQIVKSSAAGIISLKVNQEGMYECWTSNIVESICELKNQMVYNDTIYESNETVASRYFTVRIEKKEADGTEIFPVTHAKAIWWNKIANKTLYDYIQELEKTVDRLNEKVEKLPSVLYGTEDPEEDVGKDGDLYIKLSER